MTLAILGQELPRRIEAGADPLPLRPAWAQVRVPRAQPDFQTVLVVDDESDIADSMQELIERSLPRVRVVTATTGLGALQVLEREPVDLILTDYRMPGMDGLELLRRAYRMAPDVPRIMVSAFPQEVQGWTTDRHRLMKVVPKPIEAKDLLATVQAALGGKA